MSARGRAGTVVLAVALVVSVLGGLQGPAGAVGTGSVAGTVTVVGAEAWYGTTNVVVRPMAGGAPSYSAELDVSSGSAPYQVSDLPAGPYSVEVLFLSFGVFPATFGHSTVVVPPGGTATADLSADYRPACVDVTVKDAGPVPAHALHSDQPALGGTNILYIPASTETSVTSSMPCGMGGPFVQEVWDSSRNPLAAVAAEAIPGETITITIDLANPPTPVVTTTGNPYARAYADDQTGQSTIVLWRGSTDGLSLQFPATCPAAATPTAVVLRHLGASYPATPVGGGQYAVALTRTQIDTGSLQAVVTCPGPTQLIEPLGRVVLYDPSGNVTDAVSGLPVAGAQVDLYAVAGWNPAPPPPTEPPANSCETNDTKAPGDPWSQPAETGSGVVPTEQVEQGFVSPAIVSQLTDPDGHYGWDVTYGCWYVVVTADGYEPLTSPMVGIPPAVTDLDLALTPVVPAPTDVVLAPADGELGVSWTAPPGAITGYSVHVEPGGIDVPVPGGATSTVVGGLTNGVVYTVTVRASVAAGDGPFSAPVEGMPRAGGSGFHPVTPFRALDSRDSEDDWGGAPLGAGESRSLDIGGNDGIPASATAVVANVTATGGTQASYLQAYPTGAAQPVTANLLFGPGQTVPNLVTVGLGTDGNVELFNQLGSVHVIVDVVGWFDDDGTGDRFTGVTPVRALDSRDSEDDWGGAPLGAGESRSLDIGGNDGIPASATAVVANVTATGGTQASYLQAYPTGAAQPVTANLLFGPGQTVPNLVTVGLGTDGNVELFNQLGSVHVIVDVVGYFEPSTGDLFHAVTPVRVLDDRSDVGLSGPWGPNQSRSFAVAGFDASLPADATGAVLNVTATGGTAPSYLTVYPDGISTPLAANLLFGAGQTVPNLVMVKLGDPGGQAAIYNQQGTVDVIADVAGYFAAS